jgi:hypothetical protein
VLRISFTESTAKIRIIGLENFKFIKLDFDIKPVTMIVQMRPTEKNLLPEFTLLPSILEFEILLAEIAYLFLKPVLLVLLI